MSTRLREAANKARGAYWGLFDKSLVGQIEKGPDVINNEAVQSINYAGTALIDLIKTIGNNAVVGPTGQLYFYDDFLGFELNQTGTGSRGVWTSVEVNLNTAIGKVADAAGGQIALILDSDSNAEDAAWYWGDMRGIDVSKGAVIEFRARISVLPTLTAEIVMGLVGDHNLSNDAALESAWFKLDGSGAVVAESDDTTNDNDDKSTGVTVLTTDWKTYRIDFTTLADVKFYIDDVRVATATTFDMSNLTGAEYVLQPYFYINKDADAGVGTVLVDYVKIWSGR